MRPPSFLRPTATLGAGFGGSGGVVGLRGAGNAAAGTADAPGDVKLAIAAAKISGEPPAPIQEVVAAPVVPEEPFAGGSSVFTGGAVIVNVVELDAAGLRSASW